MRVAVESCSLIELSAGVGTLEIRSASDAPYVRARLKSLVELVERAVGHHVTLDLRIPDGIAPPGAGSSQTARVDPATEAELMRDPVVRKTM